MRAQIINDAFHLAQNNKIDPTWPLKIIGYLKLNDCEYLLWDTLFTHSLSFYQKIFKTTELKYNFDEYLLDLIKPIYFNLTWLDSPNDKRLTM